MIAARFELDVYCSSEGETWRDEVGSVSVVVCASDGGPLELEMTV